MARLDPLKIHTSLRRFPIFLDDLKHPDTTGEALSIVDRFSEYYAGGSMIALYQNLNKEFLEDLEVQLQEAKGPKKAKGKCSSTKSAEPYGSTTQRQGIHADLALSYDPSLASLSRKLALFFKTKSKVATDFNDFKTTTEWGNSANPESSVWPDTSNEFETSTDQDVPTYYSPLSEAEAFDCLQKQPTTPEDIPRIESPVPKKPSKSASLKSSTRTDLEMSFHAQMPAESDIFSQVDASVGVDASEVLSTTAKSKSSGSPVPSARPNTPTKSETGEVEQEPAEEPELSADALHASLEKSLEATTTEDKLFIGPGPYVQLSTSTIMEVLAGLGLSDSDPADEPEIFPSEYIKLDSDHTAKPEASTHSDTDEDITPGTFKVSPRTLQAFSTIFSALEESEADSGSQPGPEYSVKWLDFGTAMKEAGFSILPSLGSLYTFVPGEASDVPTFFTIHRPYRSVIHGDRLLLLALRLKMLYGWSKETFEAE